MWSASSVRDSSHTQRQNLPFCAYNSGPVPRAHRKRVFDPLRRSARTKRSAPWAVVRPNRRARTSRLVCYFPVAAASLRNLRCSCSLARGRLRSPAVLPRSSRCTRTQRQVPKRAGPPRPQQPVLRSPRQVFIENRDGPARHSKRLRRLRFPQRIAQLVIRDRQTEPGRRIIRIGVHQTLSQRHVTASAATASPGVPSPLPDSLS